MRTGRTQWTARAWIGILAGAVGGGGGGGRLVAAQEAGDAANLRAATTPPGIESASVGSFLAFSQPASTEKQTAFAGAFAGYDGARRAGSFEALGEVRLWGPLTIRGGAAYARADGSVRPTVGARVQLLREAHHTLDASAGIFYRPEGLTEPEGEVEAVAAAGRHLGRAYLVGNLVYGQDPEGRERDGEARVAVLGPISSAVLAGVDARLRADLGSDRALLSAHHEATADALVGPVIATFVGRIGVSLQAGGSFRRADERSTFGLFGITGVNSVF